MNPHLAIAVVIEDRYFSSLGKRGQVLTAWSIAGARLWPCPMGPDDEAEVQRICADCHVKGRDAQMVHVGQLA